MRKFVSLVLSAGLAALIPTSVQSQDQPLNALPYAPSLDLGAMDTSVDPCSDFYQYVCGGWIKNNPIPPDQAAWDVYAKMASDNRRYLWGILQSLSNPGQERTPMQQKLGDYFQACMNEQAIEQRGAAPLTPYLALIDGLQSKQALPAALAQLHLKSASDGLFFSFSSNQDYANSERVIAYASSGGLSLPDRDYYLKQDAKSHQLRAQYLEHVARMLVLAGETPPTAQHSAQAVLAIETQLARATLPREAQRDPYKLFHLFKLPALQRLTPGFDWASYLQGLDAPDIQEINVAEPAFYQTLGRVWQTQSLADIKTYLRWHVLHAQAAYLSKAFVQEDFDFFRKTLMGVPQQRPRWKRCVMLVDSQLGEALGQEFVARNFSPEIKQRTVHMTQQIEQAMAQEMAALDWMSPATKERALQKLHAVVNKIGYPEHWRDYSSYVVKDDDFTGNVERGNVFENRRQLAKIGQPLDRGEWGMTPPTVNAYYDPQMNDINFPAGVLQPPLYDPKMDSAPNYGNSGSTIGHELTHAFDDEGRQYDGHGNLKNWWTPKDAKAFEQRTQCVVNQYAQYTVVDKVKLNGKLTLGENVADLGGLVLSWLAWKMETLEHPPQARDGFTPEQRFFIGYGQWACENQRPENLRVMVATDPHSPGKFRINGTVSNMSEFGKAFACKAGQPMVHQPACKVW